MLNAKKERNKKGDLFLTELHSSSIFPYKQHLLNTKVDYVLLLYIYCIFSMVFVREYAIIWWFYCGSYECDEILMLSNWHDLFSISFVFTQYLNHAFSFNKIYLFIYLFVYLFIYLFIYVFIYLFIYLFSYKNENKIN